MSNRTVTFVGAPAALLLAASLALPAAPRPAGDGPDPKVDFFRDVRPILSQHCFQCHGPDEETREGDLRLDLRAEVMADRGGYHVVAPGDADDSELVLRVFDEDDPMPPPEGAEPLTDEQKDVLRRWVEQGADWPAHWAFEVPLRPGLPEVENGDWARDTVDRFVLARLESEGLDPAEEATREAWLRRVSFDLTGLAPTPEEIDAFLADERTDAYEQQVDRLLASKRYGERQAQDWLDLARYADSNGNQFDEPRSMWKWRDWVIDAFNANMPFDQFTIEQLAGDLLPNPTTAQLVATGFNRNHPTDTDQPKEFDEYRTEYVIDRVHTTATTFMGLTMACAQCHDHKYDPISQEEFYSFYAFFNNVAERDVDFGNPRPNLRVPNPDQEPLIADLERRIEDLEERIEMDDPYFDVAQRDWEAEALERLGEPVAWSTLEPVGMISQNGAWLKQDGDGSIVSTGPTPVRDTYDLVFQPGAGTIEALRIEVLPDEANPNGATGRADDGQFRLSRLEVRHASLSEGGESPLVHISYAEADINQEEDEEAEPVEDAPRPGKIESAIAVSEDGGGGGGFFRGGGRGWCIIEDAMTERHDAILIPVEPLELNDASVLKISMDQAMSGRARSLLGRFRWSATDDADIRRQLMPTAAKLWSTLGPYPAESAQAAFAKAYEPEADIEGGVDLKKKYAKPEEPKPKEEGEGEKGPGGKKGEGKGPGKPGEPKKGEKPSDDAPEEAEAKPAEGEAAAAAAEPAPPAGDAAAEPDAGGDDGEEEGGDFDFAAFFDEDGEFDEEAFDFFDFDRGDRGPEEIEWEEQREWRDGQRQRLSVGSGAYYLTRRIDCESPSLATLRLDGPAGVKVWLNGEVVFEEAPPPPPEPRQERRGGGGDDQEFDFAAFFGGGRRRDEADREVRLGFREGENELVVKAVFQGSPPRRGRGGGGGGEGGGMGRRSNASASITFDFTADGPDALSYEVIAALRAEAGLGELAQSSAEGRLVSKPAAGEEESAAAARRRAAIRSHFRDDVSTIGRALREELARLEDELDEYQRDLPETMVMGDRDEPRQPYVFLRGDWRQRGEDVVTRTPGALPPMADDLPLNRLGLAKWIVSGEHPLTGRVAVNRIWQQLFGTGLVETAEDFGIRGELPSHPALLDWLALDFVEGGWDVKALQCRLVLSSTYRQAAAVSAEKLERDPENRLLSRGPRQRLSAEMIRDNALHVSGLLVEEIGGPSVRPYQAPKLWSEVTGGGDWRQDKGEKQYRRGLYVYWKRRVPYPSMVTFDASKGETCTVKRPDTNTPLQALVLLNNPVYVEAAKMFGQRLLTSGDDDAARLALGFRLCTSREANEKELEVLTALLAQQREAYAEDEEGAKKLLAVGDAKVDEALDAEELAAWTAVASALLNLDATIHRG